jgi:hypothetical protein
MKNLRCGSYQSVFTKKFHRRHRGSEDMLKSAVKNCISRKRIFTMGSSILTFFLLVLRIMDYIKIKKIGSLSLYSLYALASL